MFRIAVHSQRTEQPLFSATSKCLKCDRVARFALTYPDQSNSTGKIDPERVFQFVEASYIGASSNLLDQERKIRDRLRAKDYDGAISASFTFVEKFLKIELIKLEAEGWSENQGDLRKLYGIYSKALGKDPSDPKVKALKPLLGALVSLIGGIYEVTNKLGDRHDAKAEVGCAEAQLIIKSTLSFCEYLSVRVKK